LEKTYDYQQDMAAMKLVGQIKNKNEKIIKKVKWMMSFN